MSRTKGATGKTPREMEMEAKFLIRQAKDKRKIDALKKENEALRKRGK
jgi:hypothetical protein